MSTCQGLFYAKSKGIAFIVCSYGLLHMDTPVMADQQRLTSALCSQSRSGSNGNERILHICQISRNGASLSGTV